MKTHILTLFKKLANWSSHNRFFYFVNTFILLLIILPFINNHNSKPLITTIMISLWIIVGIFSSELSSERIKIVRILGILTLMSDWLFYFRPDIKWTFILSVIITCLFFGSIIIGSIKSLIKSDKISINLISAAITVYIMIGFLGAMICRAMQIINPSSFFLADMKADMATFLYFSFITITTVGYGDLLPKSVPAQFLAMYIAIIGQLYLAVVMSIIIGKYLYAKRSTTTEIITPDDQNTTYTDRD